jgi:hypothetical protein
MSEVGKTLRQVYDAILAAYQSEKDKGAGARNALDVYLQNESLLSDVRSIISDIEDLHEIIVESLKAKTEAFGKPMKIRSGCLVSKLVPCGKCCSGCPHGPYLYKVVKEGGKQRWVYLGRTQISKHLTNPKLLHPSGRVGKNQNFVADRGAVDAGSPDLEAEKMQLTDNPEESLAAEAEESGSTGEV